MKKVFILIAVVAASASMAGAQNILLDNPDNHSYFGVRASLDIASPAAKPDAYSAGPGFSAGGIYNTPVIANLYFEPGVSFYYNTWTADKDAFSIAGQKFSDSSFRNFGMEVPLQFGYHFDFAPDINVAVYTGPAMRVGFVNKMKFDVTGGSFRLQDYIDMYSDDGLFSQIDFAWKFGVALNYGNYYIGVGGTVGMVNLYKNQPAGYVFHQDILQATLGYNF